MVPSLPRRRVFIAPFAVHCPGHANKAFAPFTALGSVSVESSSMNPLFKPGGAEELWQRALEEEGFYNADPDSTRRSR